MKVDGLKASRTFILMIGLFAASDVAAGQALAGEAPAVTPRLLLNGGWSIQSSAHVEAACELLSMPGFTARGWYPAKVPSTVLAALVAAKVYPDPYFGMNLRRIPGASYPIGRNFAKLPMPPESPFRSAWWFRTEFELPAGDAEQSIALHFDGINFRANIWLNGRRLADTEAVAGAYRRYEFDVTPEGGKRNITPEGGKQNIVPEGGKPNIVGAVRPGQRNALAVEVFPPYADDLALTWVDWNPMAPDKGMGLWREVYLTTSGPVALRHAHVISELDQPSLTSARLHVSIDARNTTDRPVEGILHGRVAGVQVAKRVELAAGETRTVVLAPEEFPQLVLSRPALWWPIGMGAQNLHDLELTFEQGGTISDRAALRFGIREVTSELTDEGHRLFRVNGRRVLIRGGGWTPDMMLRFSAERMAAELAYVRDMGLNAIRLEGKMEPEPFFELADRYGILIGHLEQPDPAPRLRRASPAHPRRGRPGGAADPLAGQLLRAASRGLTRDRRDLPGRGPGREGAVSQRRRLERLRRAATIRRAIAPVAASIQGGLRI